jgi:hypothetical protein
VIFSLTVSGGVGSNGVLGGVGFNGVVGSGGEIETEGIKVGDLLAGFSLTGC